jgi:hypothetical protein
MNKVKKDFIVYVDAGLLVFRTDLEILDDESGLDDAYEIVETYLHDKRIEFVYFDLIEVDTVERVNIT